jgi:hypothetical protein
MVRDRELKPKLTIWYWDSSAALVVLYAHLRTGYDDPTDRDGYYF